MIKMRLFLALSLVVLLFSCSKDRRTSRKMDGTWEAVVYNGYAPGQGESYHFTFNNEEKGQGTGVAHFVHEQMGFDNVYAIEYFVKEGKIVIIINNNPTVYTIVEQTRRKLKLLDTHGDSTILEKD